MDLTAEKERVIIEKFFNEARFTLREYLEDRNLNLSNSQLFAFVLVSPITIAIASDGALDFSEVNMLVDVAAYFERDVLPSQLDQLSQPHVALDNATFRKIVYSELKYLCLQMRRYEQAFIETLKKLIILDEQLSIQSTPQYSIKRRIEEMMKGVIYNNLGPDSIEEAKVKRVLNQLGIVG